MNSQREQIPATGIAVLDVFDRQIAGLIRDALPRSWQLSFTVGRSLEERQRALLGASVAFVMAAPVEEALIASADRLRFIQKLGVGTDRVDLEACRARGIAVARLAGINAVPVAEHAILLMLAALRRLVVIDRATRAGEWGKEAARASTRHLSGSVVGLIGFGQVGRSVAEMLAGFDVRILYHDKVRASRNDEKRLRVCFAPLEAILATADVVSLHLPLGPETKNILDRNRIASMKPGAVLINTARGGLVDEAALAQALKERRLSAAGLDAFAEEPPACSPLLNLPDTVVTPHIAGATLSNFGAVIERAMENTCRFLLGEELPAADVVVPPSGGAFPLTVDAFSAKDP